MFDNNSEGAKSIEQNFFLEDEKLNKSVKSKETKMCLSHKAC